jgi:hypothetical protein
MLIFTLAGSALTVSADSSNTQEKDDFETAVEILKRFYIISENDVSTANVTRKDMAFYVGNLRSPNHRILLTELKMKRDRFGGTGYFPDFDKRKYGEAINYCVDNNIMDSGWFSNPNAAVTLKDAVKMLVTALQYKINDGDYMKKASTKEVRLLGGYAVFPFTNVSADKILTKTEAVMLVYNCMMSEYAIGLESQTSKMEVTEISAGKDKIHTRIFYSVMYTSVMHTFGMYTATPATSIFTVDGKEIYFDAYNIKGSTYLKIVDLGDAFNGTSKEFFVPYVQLPDPDIQMMSISVMTGVPSTLATTSNIENKKTNVAIAFTDGEHSLLVSRVLLADGKPVYFESDGEKYPRFDPTFGRAFGVDTFEIDGEYYYKLRNVAEALDFSVSYDGAKDTVIINTSKPYTNSSAAD